MFHETKKAVNADQLPHQTALTGLNNKHDSALRRRAYSTM